MQYSNACARIFIVCKFPKASPAGFPQKQIPSPRNPRSSHFHPRGIHATSVPIPAEFPRNPLDSRYPRSSADLNSQTKSVFPPHIPLRSISSRCRSVALFGVVGGSRQSPVPGDETAWKYFTKQQLGDDKLHYTPSICHWLRRNVACPRRPWTLRPDESIAQGVSSTCFPLKCPPYPWETSWSNTT